MQIEKLKIRRVFKFQNQNQKPSAKKQNLENSCGCNTFLIWKEVQFQLFVCQVDLTSVTHFVVTCFLSILFWVLVRLLLIFCLLFLLLWGFKPSSFSLPFFLFVPLSPFSLHTHAHTQGSLSLFSSLVFLMTFQKFVQISWITVIEAKLLLSLILLTNKTGMDRFQDCCKA